MKMKMGMGIATTLIAALGASTVHAGVKEGDINIGVDPGGQLGIIFSGEVAELPEINGPLYGFGLDDPGFISIEGDFGDLSPPADGANLVVEVISFNPALKAWTPGFGSVIRNPGDTWDLGPSPVHEHPFWQIDSTDAGYVAPPGQTEWHAVVRILDTGATGYAPSEPVTLTFTPEPTSLGLLVVAGMCVSRRIQRRR